ncbi:MAG: trypsin-like peptidase domain-containing protein [Candidatus Pacebacteria bacterium]|nr:trypsin-like peptidase domain-containing protein [Candidatus Paceibacterota bacterium]
MAMDLEQLNKSQIVLLTMLVSFVTSIATGIVTVSLIEETPTDVTRVIQRVVERTVETVVPAENQQATIITREKTIIIKEADLIAAAIAENKSKIVSVVDADSGAFVSLGVFIDSDGTLAMDSWMLVEDGNYAIDVGAEEYIPAHITYGGGARGIALLTVAVERTGVSAIVPTEVALHLGQTLVAFVGSGSITQGIATELGEGGYIGTSISGTKIAPGAPLINVDGEVVGMSTGASREVGESSFAPIRAAFAQAIAPDEVVGTEEEGAAATSTEEVAQ